MMPSRTELMEAIKGGCRRWFLEPANSLHSRGASVLRGIVTFCKTRLGWLLEGTLIVGTFVFIGVCFREASAHRLDAVFNLFTAQINDQGDFGNTDPINYVAMMEGFTGLMSTLAGFCFAGIVLFIGQSNEEKSVFKRAPKQAEETALMFATAFVTNFAGAYVSASSRSEKTIDSPRAAIEFIASSFFMVLSIALMFVALLFLTRLYKLHRVHRTLKTLQFICLVVMLWEFAGTIDDAAADYYIHEQSFGRLFGVTMLGHEQSFEYLFGATALGCGFLRYVTEAVRWNWSRRCTRRGDFYGRRAWAGHQARSKQAYKLFWKFALGTALGIYLLLTFTEAASGTQEALHPLMAIFILVIVSTLIGATYTFDLDELARQGQAASQRLTV